MSTAQHESLAHQLHETSNAQMILSDHFPSAELDKLEQGHADNLDKGDVREMCDAVLSFDGGDRCAESLFKLKARLRAGFDAYVESRDLSRHIGRMASAMEAEEGDRD